MAKGQPTRAEILEARESMRKIGLKNLESEALRKLAITYIAQNNNAYGEAGNSDVEKFSYWPVMNGDAKAYDFNSGEEYSLRQRAIMGSRQDGRRYSGNVTEHGTIQNAVDIIQTSLQRVKIRDVYELLGSDNKIKAKIDQNPLFKNKYISELLESDDEASKKFAEIVISGYLQYITKEEVEKALKFGREELKSGLEKLATSNENPFTANNNSMRRAA